MISQNALKYLAVLNSHIGRRRWAKAYRAADNLDFIEQHEAAPGEATVWMIPEPASVTDINEWRRERGAAPTVVPRN